MSGHIPQPDQEDHRIKTVFEAYDDNMDGIIPLHEILEELYNIGFLIDSDSRFKCLLDYINKLPQK